MVYRSFLDQGLATNGSICRKPLPLTTVELQKAGARLLHMTPKKVLDVRWTFNLRPWLLFMFRQIAEKLYQQGFLSYPRTETDQFDSQFDFMALIDKQCADPTWGAFATQYVTLSLQRDETES